MLEGDDPAATKVNKKRMTVMLTAPMAGEMEDTVPYQKYSYPTKYPCSDCAIYRFRWKPRW